MALFQIRIDGNHTLKGNDYPVGNPKLCLIVITGMQEYSARYEPFARKMNEQGIDVAVVDHFGQGENVNGVIDDQQKWFHGVWELEIQALYLKVQEAHRKGVPVVLMGHSMGSFFVQRYLQDHPGTVDKAIIMGSCGPTNPYWLARFLSHLTTTKRNWDKPSRFITRLSVGGYKVRNQKTPLDWLSYNEKNVQDYIRDPFCGHTNTCGFYVEFFDGMVKLYQKKRLAMISKDEHILIVSGDEDPVGGRKGATALYDMYKKLGVRDVTLKLYPKMRHEILREDNARTVEEDIVAFLNKR